MSPLGCLLLCVSGLSIDYYRFDGAPRMAEAPSWEMTQGVSLSMDLKAVDVSRWFPAHLYWRNRVHGELDTSQFRLIGWQFELGIRIGLIELYRAHHSQHILDAQHPWMRFPVQDTIGVRVFLIGGDAWTH